MKNMSTKLLIIALCPQKETGSINHGMVMYWSTMQL